MLRSTANLVFFRDNVGNGIWQLDVTPTSVGNPTVTLTLTTVDGFGQSESLAVPVHVYLFPAFVPAAFPIQYIPLGDSATFSFTVGGGRGDPAGFAVVARSQQTRILPQSAIDVVQTSGASYSITVKPVRPGVAGVQLSVTDNFGSFGYTKLQVEVPKSVVDPVSVGPSGQVIEVPKLAARGFEIRLNVTAGSVDSQVDIRLEQVQLTPPEPSAGLRRAGSYWLGTPQGLTFNSPQQVCVDVTRNFNPLEQRPVLVVSHDHATWEVVYGAVYNPLQHMICGFVTGFSLFGGMLQDLGNSGQFSLIGSGWCPNDCSGHGKCSLSRKCFCHPRYEGIDCADRKCREGAAWVGGSQTDAHAYRPCSNAGQCDSATGLCHCHSGYAGMIMHH